MRNTRLIWIAAIVLVLAACGGGGGGGGSDSGSSGGSNTGSGSGSGSSNSNNSAPVADAGRQQNVEAGAKVRLDGSRSSDADGDRLSYDWSFDSRPPNSKARLQNAASATPLFTADVAGSYVAKLVVSDGNSFSKAAMVTVVASSANSVPVANAGKNQSVKTASLVNLDGSGSTDADADLNGLTYKWSFVSRAAGSNAQLADADTKTPSFTADAAGDYVVRLVVNDGRDDSAPARVTIHAAASNAAPVADAGGDRGVGVGDTVKLDGSASSDANGDALGYAWQLVSVPQGSGASLNNADTAAPSFVADAKGSYVAQVTVTDSNGASDRDRVVITAGPTLVLRADLGNDGSFDNAELPYDETYEPTVRHVPNTPDPDDESQGFVLGRFEVTAVAGDITLNLTFNLNRLNDSTGTYSAAFDGFQGFGNTATRQVTVPAGQTLEFTVNVGIPQHSQAILTYGFNAVETGDTFAATYTVVSNDN